MFDHCLQVDFRLTEAMGERGGELSRGRKRQDGLAKEHSSIYPSSGGTGNF